MKDVISLPKSLKILILSVFIAAALFLVPHSTFANEDSPTLEQNFEQGTVTEIEEESEQEVEGLSQVQIYQKMKVLLNSGVEKGKTVTIEVGGELVSNINKYEEGDKVVVSISGDPDGNTMYFIADYNRTGPLIFLAVLFLLIVIFVGRKHGIRSLGGLLISFLVIFGFIVPLILKGINPILVSTIAGVFLIPITFYLSHGLKRATTIAIIGSLIALVFTGLIATYFVKATHITGMGIEDVFFLQTIGSNSINLTNLIIAGIIISSIGILDDVTISQVSVIEQLYKANSNISAEKLFKDAMNVGKDHISSMVNTLVLVYTGASIPLLLIFSTSQYSTNYLLNLEYVALEIVRTLVTSIGLILAIPLTTFIAAQSITKKGTR